MFRKANDQKPAKRRPLRRGLLATAFAAVTLGGLGIGMDYVQGTPTPYTDPQAAQTYNIPTENCAAGIQAHFAADNQRAQTLSAEPVLVIPGFATNDMYMSSLHDAIRTAGHAAYGWDQGLNFGVNAAQAAQLGERLRQIYEDNGKQKVSIVGYSLGGIYARELAKLYPDMVESVITLGSPFGMKDERLFEVYRAFHGTYPNHSDALLQPPPVPTSSLYALADDIVPWENSLNPASPLAENLPVTPGHLRMPFDAAVARLLVDRLAQPASNWQPLQQKICKNIPK